MQSNHSLDALLVNRRSFLKAVGGAGSLALLPSTVAFGQHTSPLLRVGSRTIEVNKKAAKVFKIEGHGSRAGILAREGDRFKGTLLNDTSDPLQLHWLDRALVRWAHRNPPRRFPPVRVAIPGATIGHDCEREGRAESSGSHLRCNRRRDKGTAGLSA